MFTVIAYSESVDQAGAWNALTACADQHVRVVGNDIIVPSLRNVCLIAGLVENVAANRARLVAPSLRAKASPMIAPLNGATAGAVEPASPHAVVDLLASPVELDSGEALNFETFADPAAAQIQSGVVWLSDGPVAPATGKFFTVRATNGSTLVASAWTNGALTFDENLPRGRYRVVGMRAESAGLIAARLVPIGSLWRPGVLGCDTVNDIEFPKFRNGGMGEFCQFNDDEPPTVDFLSVSADTAQTVYLDLERIGDASNA